MEGFFFFFFFSPSLRPSYSQSFRVFKRGESRGQCWRGQPSTGGVGGAWESQCEGQFWGLHGRGKVVVGKSWRAAMSRRKCGDHCLGGHV